MKIDADFRREVTLADGTRASLRLIRADDREELRRQFRGLSPAARYRRFLSFRSELSDEALRYLTELDGVDHLALVATVDSHDLKREVLLGIARFVRLADEPEVAEAAVTVIDEAQGKGLGRILLEALVESARERGIRAFRATVLAENAPIRHILETAGATVREEDGDTLVFDLPLGEEAPASVRDPDHPLRRMLRSAAQSLLAFRFGR